MSRTTHCALAALTCLGAFIAITLTGNAFVTKAIAETGKVG
jgi:hypothetical protein